MTAERMSSVNKWRGRSAKDAILHAASDLFYSDGIRNVGVDRIIEASDIARATLYKHYRGKDALIFDYLEERNRLTLKYIADRAEKALGATEKVKSVFDHLHDRIGLKGFRGCAFLLALAEVGDSAVVRRQVVEHKAHVRQIFQGILEGGAVDHASVKADLLLILYEGVLTTAATGSVADAAQKAKNVVHIILSDAHVSPE